MISICRNRSAAIATATSVRSPLAVIPAINDFAEAPAELEEAS